MNTFKKQKYGALILFALFLTYATVSDSLFHGSKDTLNFILSYSIVLIFFYFGLAISLFGVVKPDLYLFKLIHKNEKQELYKEIESVNLLPFGISGLASLSLFILRFVLYSKEKYFYSDIMGDIKYVMIISILLFLWLIIAKFKLIKNLIKKSDFRKNLTYSILSTIVYALILLIFVLMFRFLADFMMILFVEPFLW